MLGMLRGRDTPLSFRTLSNGWHDQRTPRSSSGEIKKTDSSDEKDGSLVDGDM